MMEKKYKFVAIVSLIISIFGLFVCGYSIYDKQFDEFSLPMESKSILLNVLMMFKTLNLNFNNEYKYWDVWNLIFYALLFVGSIQFILKKGQETRLLGFVYSVIFISATVQVVLSLVTYLFFFNYKEATSEKLIFIFLDSLILVATFFVSFKILRIIKEEKEIDVTDTGVRTIIKDTGKWQRFFHWLIDLTVMALVFVPFIIALLYGISKSSFIENSLFWSNFFRGKVSLYVIIFILFFIYYPLTEILFGSTPAKFLTESRVVNHVAKHPSASTIFTRTLCRHIPFDAFSFFGKRGWHDSVSETYVVKEKRIGFKTNKLLWILPILAIYLSIIYFGKEYYENYQYRQDSLKQTELKLKFLESEIKNPNTNQFFVVKKAGYYGNAKNYGFKIEKINGDEITIKRVSGEYYSDPTFAFSKQLYQQQKDTAKTFVISKEIFVKMYPRTKEDLYKPNRTIDFFESGVHYGIEDIYYFNEPFLEAKVSRENDDYTSNKAIIYLQNFGGTGTITGMKNVDHKMKWNTSFPMKINNDINSQITISVEDYDFSGNHKTEIEVTDSLQKKHKFLMETEGLTARIQKLNE